MLDIKYIRSHPEEVAEGARKKRIAVDIDELLKLDQHSRSLQTQWEQLQGERNRLSKQIGKSPTDQRDSLKQEVAGIKQKMETLDSDLKTSKESLHDAMMRVPNPPRHDVPEGKDDNDNLEIRKEGIPREFDFEIKDHVELGEMHGILDIDRGVKIAGSRSYVLRGDLALLEAAVMRYTVENLVQKGYTPMTIPVLVKEDCMVGTGYFPVGRDQAYCVEKDQMALVGTAEVSLTSYYGGEILAKDQLPFKSFAQSSCFRREAGTYGRDTHGLYRVHQFQKVEQVIVAPADPEFSEGLHDELVQNAEQLLQDFELPYRVVYVCSGDLGQGQLRKHDIETWMPSRKSYAETHSCSTFHDFQARRLNLRYRNDQGKVETCFTLNNTAIASPRILIPLLENHQQEDGRIYIPEALQKFMFGKTHIG
jgi:seryl-tRNA synthetase